MPVVDFSEYPAPNTDAFIWMPEEEFEEYDIFCEYIQLATSAPVGTKVESGFYCRMEMSDGELCDGTILVTQLDVPSQIRWECRKCKDKGAIINFEGTPWDNSELSEQEKKIFLDHFFSDITGEDIYEDEFYDLYEDDGADPFDDFEYYINPFDPEGEQSGGPSSVVIEELLHCDWNLPDSPIYLKDNLSLSKVEKSFFFDNARQFLLTLKEEKSFPLTRSGLLKRKMVKRLLKQTRWPDNYIETMTEDRKRPDETDIWLLHGIRVLLDMAELIEEKENSFRLNKKVKHMLDEENAGQLYRHLFSVYFKEMNLGYLGSTFELPHLQYSVPFILFKLHKLAKNWIPVEDLLPQILLYPVTLELQFEDLEGTSIAHDLLHDDLFSSLNRFGLIETRDSEDNPPDLDQEGFFTYPDQIRVTPLMEQFIVFNVE